MLLAPGHCDLICNRCVVALVDSARVASEQHLAKITGAPSPSTCGAVRIPHNFVPK